MFVHSQLFKMCTTLKIFEIKSQNITSFINEALNNLTKLDFLL